MTSKDISEIKTLLAKPRNIAIIPHRNPDGDAIGSTLGLYHYLKNKGHDTNVVAPNDYPEFLKWIPGEEHIVKFESQTEASNKILEESDIIFTLDFNHLSRVGNSFQEALEAQKEATFIMIDHHQQPDSYATYTYSDVTMSSTCEMVYNLLSMLGDKEQITEAIATCLYTGIMTDTGSFRFKSTTSETHLVTSQLIKAGATPSSIHNNIYDSYSLNRLQLLGTALNNLRVESDYNAAFISLSQDELNSHNFKKGDTEGFVNYCLSISGIKLAAIFIENKADNIVKISLRSKGDFSVNKMARAHFEGGGHTNAAGGKSDLNLKDTVAKFISILPTYKNELKH